VGFAGGRMSSEGQPDRHWSERNGQDWRALAPAAQTAYTEGFLAGVSFGQAGMEACGRPCASMADSTAVAEAMTGLRRTGRFRFPYAANVYVSRLNDYYWWENHRVEPTWHAFWEVNTSLISPTNDPAR
jgi:hypothetical protein